MDLEEFLVKIEDPDFVARVQKGIGDAVAIATTTFYREDNPAHICRAALAELMIEEAIKLGYEVFDVDGGSDLEFIKKFEKAGAKIIPGEEHYPGAFGIGRRRAKKAAYETSREVIAWTEPEKVPYVSQIVKTALPILENLTDLTLPQRKSLKTYPYLQQLADQLGNAHWKDVTRLLLDVWFGPRTFRGKSKDRFDVAKHFLNYDGWSLDGKRWYGDQWDSIFLPIIDAYMNGARCLSVPIDYEHPRAQTESEEGNPEYNIKRLEQLSNLMPAILYRWEEYKKMALF